MQKHPLIENEIIIFDIKPSFLAHLQLGMTTKEITLDLRVEICTNVIVSFLGQGLRKKTFSVFSFEITFLVIS